MTNARVLDWRPSKDPRNALFLASSLDCYAVGTARAKAQRTKGVDHYLNQGKEGACTGFGAGNVMLLGPRHLWSVTNNVCFGWYNGAKTMDEWPGIDYEGSSVNGAMLYIKTLNLIKSYHWCKTLREVRHAVSYHGAV